MRGICFKEPLFLKVVAGEKTQTRRIIVKQPDSRGVRTTNVMFEDWHGREIRPLYKIGKIIYLKEPYFVWEPEHCESMSKRFAYKYWDKQYKMKAEIQEAIRKEEFELGYDTYYWHNKLFMPERAARYFIKITNIAVERAQQITEADAILEGCKNKAEFENWWIKIHGFSSWKENPWVFCYQFKLVNKPNE